MPAIGRKPLTDVTPEQAKFVWESFGRPSLRKVAAAFAAANRPVDFQQLSAWRNAGWKRREDLLRTKAARAVDSLDIAMPALSASPATRIQDFVDPVSREELSKAEFGFGLGPSADLVAEIDTLRRALTGISDEALMREEAREMKITNIILQRVIQRQAPQLVADNAAGIAVVIDALGKYPGGSNECYDKVISYRERAATIIDGTAKIEQHIPRPEENSLLAAIAEAEKNPNKFDIEGD